MYLGVHKKEAQLVVQVDALKLFLLACYVLLLPVISAGKPWARVRVCVGGGGGGVYARTPQCTLA